MISNLQLLFSRNHPGYLMVPVSQPCLHAHGCHGKGFQRDAPRWRYPDRKRFQPGKGWINMQGQVVVCCVHVAIWSDEPVCGMFAAPFEVRRVTCVFVDTFTALGMDVDIWHWMWGSPVRFKEPKRCVGLNLRPKGAQLVGFIHVHY